MPGDQAQEPERGQDPHQEEPGIRLNGPGSRPIDHLGRHLVEVKAMIGAVVARVVHSFDLRHQVEVAVLDALLESCAECSNPDRVTAKWLAKVARCASFGRKHRDCRTVAIDLESVPVKSAAAEQDCDPELCAAFDQALARMGPRSRAACLAYRVTLSVPRAAEATGMSTQNVNRARRRLRELVQEFLRG